jgi:hypothetical protein
LRRTAAGLSLFTHGEICVADLLQADRLQQNNFLGPRSPPCGRQQNSMFALFAGVVPFIRLTFV